MIDYIPKFSKLPKRFIVLEILWKRGVRSSSWTNQIPTEYVETFPVSQERIYTDLMAAEKKIQALKLTWDDDTADAASKCRIVFVPAGLLSEPKETLEHVLVRFVSALFPFKGSRVILTHDAETEMPALVNALTLINTIQRAKDMAMLPANVATPMYLARTIQRMFRRDSHVRSHLYDAAALKKKHCGLILAVGGSASAASSSAGSAPCLLTLERPAKTNHKGQKTKPKTLCLVGKGVSFDSGGLSLKSLEGMVDMKYDKIGAVYMAHVFQLLVRDPAFDGLRLVAVLPFAENAVSASAVHPGDVITSASGKTVEITDPDAEGRLLLADAFAIAAAYEPEVLMDLATLTGHSDSINCFHKGYVYCQPESLRFKVEKWTNRIGERMLTMPTWPEYASVLKSNVADYTNAPSDCNDAFTAALFLRAFLPPSVHTWIHIDLAHEFDDHVPAGNGIRALHMLAHEVVG